MQRTILITGARGTQGAAVLCALQSRHVRLRALVRDTLGCAASRLAASGVELVEGDFDDTAALRKAIEGVDGVFSMQVPPLPNKKDREVRHARNLVEAAKAAGVESFVQTSVARAGDHESFLGWADQRWWPLYWTSKAEANDLVRNAGFAHWVILKPAYMMENFIPPKCQWMFPGLEVRGVIESVMDAGVPLDLIAADDIGRFAAAALTQPGLLHGQDVDLAGDSLTMGEVAAVISQATGQAVSAQQVTADEALALGNHAGLSESQAWASVEGYRVDLAGAAARGIPLTTFADWARANSDCFVIGPQAEEPA